MYPVRLGYSAAVGRVKKLLRNGHDAEALVTAVFTVEKTLRRTLRQLIVSAGFASSMSDKVVGSLRGLDAVKENWVLYDPKNRRLTDLISSADWRTFKDCAGMRNKLIHGERVYGLAECKRCAENALAALDSVKNLLDGEYGYSGWTTASKRIKSKLHLDPRVRVAP